MKQLIIELTTFSREYIKGDKIRFIAEIEDEHADRIGIAEFMLKIETALNENFTRARCHVDIVEIEK